MWLKKNSKLAILIVLLGLSTLYFFFPVFSFELPSFSKTDSRPAFEVLLEKAQKGDAESQYQLALKYQNGRGVPKDSKKAFELYQKAADQGHVKAQNNLGFCYEYGDGTETDIENAIFWYQKAAENGLELALENLGKLYYHKEDYTKALLWFSKAADLGNANAQSIAGDMYRLGQGVEKDQITAIEYYKKAAEQGAAEAQYNLASHYEDTHNNEAALYWYSKASDQNFPEAYLALAKMHYMGSGVEKNLLKAGKLYKKAADEGLVQSQEYLSKKASQCVQPYAPTEEQVNACFISAGAGYSGAYKLLSTYYYFGQGVEKDPIEALAWGFLTPKDETTVKDTLVMAKLVSALDKESLAAATAKADEYRKEYMQERIGDNKE